jgi:hypothetical protein
MRSLLVVMEQKLLGHLLHLLQGPRPMDLQALVTKGAVKSFDNSLDAIDKSANTLPED